MGDEAISAPGAGQPRPVAASSGGPPAPNRSDSASSLADGAPPPGSTRSPLVDTRAATETTAAEKQGGEHFQGSPAHDKPASPQETSYQFVEITNVDGVPIGEFDVVVHDGVATDRFIEDKNARGLKHPKNRRTPSEWARVQIFDKTTQRIRSLEEAVEARARPDRKGSASVPTLEQLRTIREFEFVVESTDPEVRAAVEVQVVNLRTDHSEFRFKARFGK